MSLNRRNFLQNLSLGSAGTLLAPVLAQLDARADGVERRPQRVVIVMEGNGLPADQVQPPEVAHSRKHGLYLDYDLTDLSLPEALEPLEAFKDRLTIIQGLSSRIIGPATHSADFGALGCFPRNAVRGETLDVTLGRALPALFPNVTLGMIDDPLVNVVYNCTAAGKGKALPTIVRPDFAFATLFGSVAEGSSRAVVEARTSLLDYMSSDLRKIEKQLAAPEREQLSHYLQSFEAMHARQNELVKLREKLKRHAAGIPADQLDLPTCMGRLAAQFDIGAAALTAGLTNVLVLASGVGNSFFMVKHTELGIGIDKHKIGHQESYEGRDWRQLAVQIRREHMKLIAQFAAKLQAVPEGDGTMLDNTLIVYTSDGAEWHHATFYEWPFVVLGDLGGKFRPGRLIDYPGYGFEGHRTVANLYLSILNAVGDSRESFGIADPVLKDFDQKGPLAEWLA